jgi:flagellar biosynthetic protein FlhB
MSETADRDSRTEQATEKKIRDSVEKGKVPVSREVAMFASVAAMLIVGGFLLEEGVARFTRVLQRLLDRAGTFSLENGADATLLARALLEESSRFVMPILIAFMIAGIVASVVQNAPRFVPDRIQPELSRLSPFSGWRRIFGLQGQTEFLKGVFKLAAVGTVVAMLLRSQSDAVLSAIFLDPKALPDEILGISMRLLSAVCIATVLLVAADLVWARLHWLRDLRMSRQEIKDEAKELEGDPLVKARLRSLALDRARKRMIAAVPKATLVIANPTHYAIALQYIREKGGAPVVVAKGQDLIALKIREIAEANNIPVIEDKALARSMYDSVEVDQMIPPEFYRAVAELLHFLQARAGRAVTGR